MSDEEIGDTWSPETLNLDPHAFDYKVRVRDECRDDFRSLLLGGKQGEGRVHFDLEDLEPVIERRRYQDSEAKRGMFLQASCLVTDGVEEGRPTRVLLNQRTAHQFHDVRYKRNVIGWSGLFGTLFHPLSLIKGNPELPASVLNSLDKDGRFAVFGRKLLMPAELVDCGFLGVGFNFTNPAKEYVHFVWHVRCPGEPEVHVVPERKAKKHDRPCWVNGGAAEVAEVQGPIDQLALEHLGLRSEGETDRHPELTGFLPRPNLEGAPRVLNYRRYSRDTVIHDLLLLLQVAVHRGILDASQHISEHDFRDKVAAFLTYAGDKHLKNLRIVTEAPQGLGRRASRCDLVVEFSNSQNRERQYRYLLEFKVCQTKREGLEGGVGQTNAYQVLGQAPVDAASLGGSYDAAYLIRAIRSPQQVEDLQGLIALDLKLPIFLLNCSLQPVLPSATRALKRITHALILGRDSRGGMHILMTRGPEDAGPQLPGGKLEEQKRRPGHLESAQEGLRRELGEELDLVEEDVLVMEQISPPGRDVIGGLPAFFATEVSPSSHEPTGYRFTPFLTVLTQEGGERLIARLGEPDHYPFFVPLEEWSRTGMGFDPAYAASVMRELTAEQIQGAAIDLPTP